MLRQQPRKLNYCAPLLGIIISLASTYSYSQTCRDNGKTELEDIYCQIKAKGKGSSLPDYQQFRRNPLSTQRLLLKQPARKLGIELPAAASSRRARNSLIAEPVIHSQAMTSDTESTTPEKPRADRKKTPVQPTSTASSNMQSCQLHNETIVCDNRLYELQTNLNNKNISPGALGATNKLVLPKQNTESFKSASTQYYLSQSYVLYIEKMITIGLADATMSFTKFAAMHSDIENRGGDFSGRFEKMFELLKKEKSTNAVKSRYNNNYPESLKQCMSLSRKLIVCDNVKQNWIYRRDG